MNEEVPGGETTLDERYRKSFAQEGVSCDVTTHNVVFQRLRPEDLSDTQKRRLLEETQRDPLPDKKRPAGDQKNPEFAQARALLGDESAKKSLELVDPMTWDDGLIEGKTAAEILGVPPDADLPTAYKAYRRLIKTVHPDKIIGDLRRAVVGGTFEEMAKKLPHLLAQHDKIRAAGGEDPLASMERRLNERALHLATLINLALGKFEKNEGWDQIIGVSSMWEEDALPYRSMFKGAYDILRYYDHITLNADAELYRMRPFEKEAQDFIEFTEATGSYDKDAKIPFTREVFNSLQMTDEQLKHDSRFRIQKEYVLKYCSQNSVMLGFAHDATSDERGWKYVTYLKNLFIFLNLQLGNDLPPMLLDDIAEALDLDNKKLESLRQMLMQHTDVESILNALDVEDENKKNVARDRLAPLYTFQVYEDSIYEQRVVYPGVEMTSQGQLRLFLPLEKYDIKEYNFTQNDMEIMRQIAHGRSIRATDLPLLKE